MRGASLRDRAGRVSPQAGSRLGHPATIPSAMLFDLNLSNFSLGIAQVRIGPPGRLLVRDIQNKVADYYGIPRETMTWKRGSPHATQARHVAMYLSRQLTEMSYPELGRRFGGIDHSSAMHACKAVSSRLCRSADLKADIEILRAELAR